MNNNRLKITDHRTGRSYEIPVVNDTIPAMGLRQIKVAEEDFGMMTYDPAFLNTAACKSEITYIDGAKGILRYRGYPIEELAEKSSFLEVAYLLIHGKLPDAEAFDEWSFEITHHTLVHENLKKFMDGFLYDAHPMGMIISTIAALATFYPDARSIQSDESRHLQILRLLGKIPTISAYAYRRTMGLPYAYPDNDLSYAGNFLNMMFKLVERRYQPNPVLEQALDVLFILHADHEQNCSTSAMRSVGSSHTDPYSSLAAAAAALSGPLHGGANEAVLRMLHEIGAKSKVPDLIKKVKKGETRLMGFGHRVYKNYDPRATIIKKLADQVFEIQGVNPLLEIALELERIALQDEYFVKRKLYPNVDFYSGLIYQSMGFPVDMFPVLFAIGRTAGWLAQWNEMLEDPDQRIARPRQVYVGEDLRRYVAMEKR